MVGFGGSTLCATESYSLCIKYPEEAFQRQINLNGPENKRKFTWGSVKKNCEKAVRLTAWVDPPRPHEAVRKM